MVSYLPLLLLFLVAGVVAVALFTLTSVLGPKNPTVEKMMPFECGSDSTGSRFVRPSVKFYLVAILFILFDLEIAFLFPWAVSLHEIGASGFWAMMIFLGILVVGFAYEWKKGALDWE